MKKLKMLFLSIVLMIVGVVRVDALTKSDLDYMESDFVSLFYSEIALFSQCGTKVVKTVQKTRLKSSKKVGFFCNFRPSARFSVM